MILIEKDSPMAIFLGEVIPKLTSPETELAACPHCKERIFFPIVAKEQDIRAFQQLIGITMEYLHEKGIVQQVFDDLRKKVNERIKLQ